MIVPVLHPNSTVYKFRGMSVLSFFFSVSFVDFERCSAHLISYPRFVPCVDCFPYRHICSWYQNWIPLAVIRI